MKVGLSIGKRRLVRLSAVVFTLLALTGGLISVSAQPQCAVASTVQFPVDRSRFTLTQDFAVPSVRHQGRYHTGEDWHAERGATAGEPVFAIANGRVTYASSNAWGRDGGVIIIEHTFAEGTVAYSMYGHITDQTGIQFPTALTCIRQGDMLAAIADVRPAPHLHFEIRTSNSGNPGAGYAWENPAEIGLRRPSKFLLNMQTWLSDSYRWRLDLADEVAPQSPPVTLPDNSLIYADADRVFRASPDGRILWRVNGDSRISGVIPFGDAALIVYADGRAQPVSLDATLSTAWNTNAAFSSAPFRLGNDRVALRDVSGGLSVYSNDLRLPVWTLESVDPLYSVISTGRTVGLMTEANEALLLDASTGQLINRGQLREPGTWAISPEGGLLAYTLGGLWSVSADGVWSLYADSVPGGGRGGAVAFARDGRLFAYDGDILRAYGASPGFTPLWQVDLPDTLGRAELAVYEPAVLLTTSDGHIIALQAETGGLCNQTQLWGDWRAGLWRWLAPDGLLRVYIADQILALQWSRFLLACNS